MVVNFVLVKKRAQYCACKLNLNPVKMLSAEIFLLCSTAMQSTCVPPVQIVYQLETLRSIRQLTRVRPCLSAGGPNTSAVRTLESEMVIAQSDR